jgi:membrane protease YdiL (CAAX protease family)
MSTHTAARATPPAVAVTAFIRRHPLASYLIMAFAGGWAFLIPALVLDAPVRPFTALGALVGLAAPAFLVTAVVGGRAGAADRRRRSLRWRVGPPWYLLAALALPAGTLLLGSALFGMGAAEVIAAWGPLLLTVYATELLLALVTTQWAEELGWTAFVQDTLQARHGAMLGSLLVAPLFLTIHLPLYLIGKPLTGDAALLALAQVVAIGIFAVFFRVLLTWVYNGAGRSGPMAALLHASFNTVSGAAFLAPFGARPGAELLPLAVVVALALLGAVVTRGRLAFPRRRQTAPLPPAVHE